MRIMSREFCYSLEISYQTILNWRSEGMPAEQYCNGYVFLNEESYHWVIKNKPKYSEKAIIFLEAKNGEK